MTNPLPWALVLLFGSFCVYLVARSLHERTEHRRTLAELTEAQTQFVRSTQQRVDAFIAEHQLRMHRADWLDWWLRNAAETTPLEKARPHLIRFALASALAPSFEAFRADLHSVCRARHEGSASISAAQGFLHDLALPEVPWRALDAAGTPRHRRGAVTDAYRALMHRGWVAFLDPLRERSNSMLPEGAEEKTQ